MNSAKIIFDTVYTYINTVYDGKHWIPVVGRQVSVNDEMFFVFTVDLGPSAIGYIMKVNDPMPIMLFQFNNYEQITQIVTSKLCEYYIRKINGEAGVNPLPEQFVPKTPKPPIVRQTDLQLNSVKGQRAIKQVLNYQKTLTNGQFSQSF